MTCAACGHENPAGNRFPRGNGQRDPPCPDLTDSELLFRQMKGLYRVRNSKLIPLFLEAIHLVQEFADFEIQHIPREKNKEADLLANRAIDAKSREPSSSRRVDGSRKDHTA